MAGSEPNGEGASRAAVAAAEIGAPDRLALERRAPEELAADPEEEVEGEDLLPEVMPEHLGAVGEGGKQRAGLRAEVAS